MWQIVGIAPAGARELKVTIAPSFTTGTYGTEDTTDTVETPVRFRYKDGPYKLAIRLPYLRVTGPQSPVPNVGLVGSTSVGRSTVRGFGDLGLAGSVRVLGGGDNDWFELEMGLGMRLPTGNKSRGLGSGQIGLSPHFDATIDFASDLSLELTLGRFIRTRHPENMQLRDYFYGGIVLNYDITSAVTIGLSVDMQQASVTYGTGVLEAGVFAEHEFESGTRIGINLFRGFTRDSSAFGVGLLFSHKFAW